MSGPQVGPAEVWSAYAQHYDTIFSRYTTQLAFDTFAVSRTHLPSGAVAVLDVACGSGSFERALVQAYTEQPLWFSSAQTLTVLATDLAHGMVQIVDDYLRTVSTAPILNISAQVEDATQLAGVVDGSMDAVYSLFGIFLVPDRAAVFASTKRVLKAGGLLVFTSWAADPPNSVFNLVGVLLAGLPERLRPARLPGASSPFDFCNAEACAGVATAAGFKVVAMQAATTTMTFADVDEVYRFLRYTSPPSGEVLRQLTVEEQLAMKEQLRTWLHSVGQQGGGPFAIEAAALITIATT